MQGMSCMITVTATMTTTQLHGYSPHQQQSCSNLRLKPFRQWGRDMAAEYSLPLGDHSQGLWVTWPWLTLPCINLKLPWLTARWPGYQATRSWITRDSKLPHYRSAPPSPSLPKAAISITSHKWSSSEGLGHGCSRVYGSMYLCFSLSLCIYVCVCGSAFIWMPTA